jgi:hypothetical protein
MGDNLFPPCCSSVDRSQSIVHSVHSVHTVTSVVAKRQTGNLEVHGSVGLTPLGVCSVHCKHSWYKDSTDGHIEYDIVVIVSKMCLNEFLLDQHLPPLPDQSPSGNTTTTATTANTMVEFTISKRFREMKIFEKTLKKLINNKKISSLMPSLPSSLNMVSSAKGIFNTIGGVATSLGGQVRNCVYDACTDCTRKRQGPRCFH